MALTQAQQNNIDNHPSGENLDLDGRDVDEDVFLGEYIIEISSSRYNPYDSERVLRGMNVAKIINRKERNGFYWANVKVFR